MPGNRKLQRNGSATEEVMRRVKLEDTDENGRVGDEPGAFPDRPGEPDCIYYLRTGSCGYGSNCRFNHPTNVGQVNGVKSTNELPERAGQPDCGYYLKTGTCKYGSTCKYHHPKDRQVDASMNILGLPMRQDSSPCPYYMRTGSCRYGFACKFHHPQPALAANVPVVGPVYGTGGSLAMPSSGATSVGELSAASLSKATYFPTSLQLQQSYMPLFLSPSQGWNTYPGSISPLAVTSVLTAPASNGQLSVSYLPERPEQPECRYFMTHGSCKYGPDCKYHHPREKMSQLASCSLGPLGLPLRPGQPICSHYNLYGLCKYGPTCRFDHPVDGYPYGYSMGLPPLATAYMPSTPIPRMAPLVPLSETSLSRSSKLSDWIKKGATASNKNQNSNSKSLGDPHDQSDSDSLPYSSKNQNSNTKSLGDPHDQSDSDSLPYSSKNQNSNTKSLGDPHDQSDSLPYSSKAPYELIHYDESD